MTAEPLIEDWVLDLLRCPVTGARLVARTGPDGDVELVGTDADRTLAYPVRGGVPVLLVDEAREVAAP
ncbi:MAG: hypothetical protein FWD11_10570 [Micrococcales bacterium]|nr:hypothetical protein [Micrococcales bacterium]